jgi:O-antigen/teichoic acid export membrane protein
MDEAREMFKGADVDWEKMENLYPEVDMDGIKEYVKNVKGWDSIGFQRVLGGIFYDYGLSIVEMMLGFLILPIMVLVAMPYPSSEGYYGIAAGFFASLFTIFDFGTAYGLERFIGEFRVKNPKKMLGYINFFIWWQMITGLIQVTVVSVFALYVFPGTDLSYASWLFLILSTTQYPGMLGYFKSLLRGLQAFHYDNIVDFFRSNVFDLITRIVFILLFRWIGLNNPAIGDLMGLAIGSAIGRYVDEFINMALAIWFFNKVMKKQKLGVRAKDCFNFRYIDWSVAKTSMWWGFQLSLPGMIGSLWGFASLMVTLTYLPQYQHWNTVAGLVGAVTTIVTIGSKLSLTPAMAEAYMNGKTELAQFYIENAFKWYFTLMWGVVGLLVVFLPSLMGVVLSLPGAENYQLAIPFMVPVIINSIFRPIDGYLNSIMVSTNHPTAKTIIDVVGQITGFTWHFFSYAILAWQVKFVVDGIVMLYSFAVFAH